MTAPTLAFSTDTKTDTSSHQNTRENQARQTVQTRIQVAPASALLDATVEDVKRMEVGTIDYLMIDARTGNVSFVLLRDDERADQLTPVPWRALDVSKSGERVRVRTEKARIGQASRYRLETLAEMTAPAAMTTAYEYWAPLVAADERARGEGAGDQSAQTGPTGQKSAQGETVEPSATKDQSDKMSQSSQSGQTDRSETNTAGQASQSAQGADRGTANVPHILVGRGYVTTLMPPQYRFAEQISGSVVEGTDGEDLGEIAELMIDVRHGQVAYVQVARGGFLGMDEKMVPVPFAALAYVPNRNTYRLDVSAKKFQEKKAFTRADQPTSVRMKDLGELYRMYNADPYWQTSAAGQSSQKKG